MRTLEEARSSLKQFQPYDNLNDLRTATRQGSTEDSPATGSRSLLWKIFLLYESLDQKEWLQRSSDSRSAYSSVRSHLLRGLEHPEEVLGSNLDPLSEDTESPWAVLRHDETLRAEIMQDVDRCMPDNVYFRQPATQAMMLDVLFVFCKLNPDVGYRQGMHELLAPILWVVEKDAVSSKATDDSSSDDKMLCRIFDSAYIEHDTFTLFGIVMQGAKSFYEQAAHSAPSKLSSGPAKPGATLENPILTRIHRIFDEYLPHVDPSLAKHLQEIDLIPQVFLMRWIRLLFGREFNFDDVLDMWDVIFSEDPSLEIADLVCLNMILRLHWDLMDADYNTALTILLRYPSLEDGKTPHTFVADALYLKDNFNQSGASTLVEKYSGRPLGESIEVPTISIQPTFPGKLGARLQAGFTPPRLGRNPSNFEGILHDAAKGMLSRGEKWGINKALRDAVDEVRKGVREIQAVQTPQAPYRHTRTLSRQSGTSESTPNVGLQLAALEQRNAALAKMLKNATDDLWEYHRIAGEKAADEDALKSLSVAIAKVQLTQVYLGDTSVPLPTEEEPLDDHNETSETKDTQPQTKETETTPSSNNAEKQAEEAPPVPEKPKPEEKAVPAEPPSQPSRPTPTPAEPPKDFHTPRPSLAQSSFSWMLGQSTSTTPDSFARANPLAPSDARRRSKGFLFGDDDTEDKGNSKGTLEKRKDGKRGSTRKKPSKSEILFEQDDAVEEEFDLGALEEEKKKEEEEKRKQEEKEKEREKEKEKGKKGKVSPKDRA